MIQDIHVDVRLHRHVHIAVQRHIWGSNTVSLMYVTSCRYQLVSSEPHSSRPLLPWHAGNHMQPSCTEIRQMVFKSWLKNDLGPTTDTRPGQITPNYCRCLHMTIINLKFLIMCSFITIIQLHHNNKRMRGLLPLRSPTMISNYTPLLVFRTLPKVERLLFFLYFCILLPVYT